MVSSGGGAIESAIETPEPSIASSLAAMEADAPRHDEPGEASAAASNRTDNRNVPIKQLLSRKRRRHGMQLMPSTLKRMEEQKQRRRAKRLKEAADADALPDETDAPGSPSHTQQSPADPNTQQTPADPNTQQTPADPNTQQTPADPNTQVENPNASSNGEHVAESPPAQTDAQPIEDEQQGGVIAPQMTIDEDGNIVIDQSSLVVAATSMADNDADRTVNTLEIQVSGNHISSCTFAKRESSVKWRVSETEVFYQALRTFGTDFSLMLKLLPGRTRRQLKLKFKREERTCPERIEEALSGPPLPIPDAFPNANPNANPNTLSNGLDDPASREGDPRLAGRSPPAGPDVSDSQPHRQKVSPERPPQTDGAQVTNNNNSNSNNRSNNVNVVGTADADADMTTTAPEDGAAGTDGEASDKDRPNEGEEVVGRASDEENEDDGPEDYMPSAPAFDDDDDMEQPAPLDFDSDSDDD